MWEKLLIIAFSLHFIEMSIAQQSDLAFIALRLMPIPIVRSSLWIVRSSTLLLLPYNAINWIRWNEEQKNRYHFYFSAISIESNWNSLWFQLQTCPNFSLHSLSHTLIYLMCTLFCILPFECSIAKSHIGLFIVHQLLSKNRIYRIESLKFICVCLQLQFGIRVCATLSCENFQ